MLQILSEFPLGFIVGVAFVFGVIIGSFLNVYLYRFHTGKSLMGSSHCLSCGQSLRAWELVPLLSYLFLRGRCQECKSYIPRRYFLVELLTGLLFVGVVFTAVNLVSLILLFIIVSILVVIAVYDYYHLIIANELVAYLVLVVLANQFYLYLLGQSLFEVTWNLVAALLASFFLFLLWLISRGTWLGFGDVKLVFPLALSVGAAQVFSMVVLSFWIGTIISLALLVVQKIKRRGQPYLRFVTKGLTMKSAVPFAPFLILGYLAVIFFGIDVLSLFSYAI